MPVTTVNTGGTYDQGNVVKQWSRDITHEYIKNEELAPWSGKKAGAVFQYKMDLTGKPGDEVTFPLVCKLENDGVEDDDTMDPEALGNYADSVTIHQLRHGVTRGNHEQRKTVINILNEGRFMLKEWAMEKLRDLKIARMLCPHLDGITTYASATEAEKDAHLTANDDRYLFGALISNLSAGDHSASLATVDVTADTLNRAWVSKAKRMCEDADPLIHPIRIEGIKQEFVYFCGTAPHRDLKEDLDTIHVDARERAKSNPAFQDDDLFYAGCVVRKVPAMTSIGDVGAASAPVYQVAVCGLQAVLVAFGQMVRPIRNGPEGEDWGNLRGVGVKTTRGAKKTHFNSVQHGMLTGYVAAEADA